MIRVKSCRQKLSGEKEPVVDVVVVERKLKKKGLDEKATMPTK